MYKHTAVQNAAAAKTESAKVKNKSQLVAREQHKKLSGTCLLWLLVCTEKRTFFMESSSAKITILFEDPLWIGLYER